MGKEIKRVKSRNLSKRIAIIINGNLRQLLIMSSPLKILARKLDEMNNVEIDLYIEGEKNVACFYENFEWLRDVFIGDRAQINKRINDQHDVYLRALRVNNQKALDWSLNRNEPLRFGYAKIMGLSPANRNVEIPQIDFPLGTEGDLMRFMAIDRVSRKQVRPPRNRGIFQLITYMEDWPPMLLEEYAELTLIRSKIPTVIATNVESKEVDIPDRLRDICKIVETKSIWDLCELMLTCRYHVCFENSAAHLAAGIGIPSVVIISDDPRHFKAYSYHLHYFNYLKTIGGVITKEEILDGCSEASLYFDSII